MKITQAAIIGCGAIHRLHAEAIQQNSSIHLRAIVEANADSGLILAGRYGCSYYADYRELLQDQELDVVHICTPHDLHKEMIIATLAAGKHVFTEKPVALNCGEIKQIKAALAQSDARLGVCYQNRLNTSSQAIKSLLESGQLGKMLGIKALLTWSRTPDYYQQSGWRGRLSREGGSLLINQAIHTLDLMQWFAGGVSAVKGVTESTFLADATEGEDTAVANMMMTNGARGIFYATNGYTTDSPLLLEIHCEQGLLQLNDNNLWLIKEGEKQLLASDTLPVKKQKCYWGSSHQLAINQFYHAVQTPADTPVAANQYVDIHQAEKSLCLVEAIYRSSQLRRWIMLKEE
ncbi:Gfo/Idh/MocA family protein [Dryocola clanedunensis]